MQTKIIGKGGGEAGISSRHHPGLCSDVRKSGESPDTRKSEPGREQLRAEEICLIVNISYFWGLS